MKTILFVDHEFHTKTKSTGFFLILLRQRFHVKVLYLDPGATIIEDLQSRTGGVDIVLLWQLDFLAPVFLALGLPTVVIPMYDGSSTQDSIHWLVSSKARFFNFSYTLHHRIRLLGIDTLLVKYFPEPAPESERARFDKLSLFFWQRRPEEGLNLGLVRRLLCQQPIELLTLHDVPDNAVGGDLRHLNHGYNVVRTKWYETPQSYRETLANHNIFMAPRYAEGIGFAFLEAMARGMVVIAASIPTHSEYIADGINGILFNPKSPEPIINLASNGDEIGHASWRSVAEGRHKWLLGQNSVLDWIDQTPTPIRIELDFQRLAQSLWRAYYAGSTYKETLLDLLRNHPDLLGDVSDFKSVVDPPSGSLAAIASEPQIDGALSFPILDFEYSFLKGGIAEEFGTRLRSRVNTSGHLSYGPYMRLERGHYLFVMNLLVDVIEPERSSEIFVEVVYKQALFLARERFVLNPGAHRLDLRFSITPYGEKLCTDAEYEFRLWVNSVNPVEIIGSELERTGFSSHQLSTINLGQILYPGAAGERFGTSIRSGRGKDGHVFYGPYCQLLPGRYKLGVRITSSNAIGEMLELDVTCAQLDRPISIAHKTTEVSTALDLYFDLIGYDNDIFDRVEFRLRRWNGPDISVDSVTLTCLGDSSLD